MAQDLWSFGVAFILGAVFGAMLVAVLARLGRAGIGAGGVTAARGPSHEEQSLFVDPATGLASRRYIEMLLEKEISRSERFGKPVSVALFDLDDSSRLVRSLGAQSVEALLRDMGELIQSFVREYDVVGKYSDGRLVVILPESSAEQAVKVARRLHQSLGCLRLGGKAPSVSVGVAAFPEHASSVDELLRSAHHALNVGRACGSDSRVYCCEVLDQAS